MSDDLDPKPRELYQTVRDYYEHEHPPTKVADFLVWLGEQMQHWTPEDRANAEISFLVLGGGCDSDPELRIRLGFIRLESPAEVASRINIAWHRAEREKAAQWHRDSEEWARLNQLFGGKEPPA